MGKKYVLSGVIGGMIAYFWGAISWTALPWHEHSMDRFLNEAEVSEVIRLNAPRQGVYLLPTPLEKEADMTSEEADLLKEENMNRLKEGPFAYMVIRPRGMDPSSPVSYFIGLLSQMIAALMLTYLVLRARIARYWARVQFMVIISVLVGILGVLPNQIWWGVTTKVTVIGMLDLVIAWGLAALWIAKHTKPVGLPHS